MVRTIMAQTAGDRNQGRKVEIRCITIGQVIRSYRQHHVIRAGICCYSRPIAVESPEAAVRLPQLMQDGAGAGPICTRVGAAGSAGAHCGIVLALARPRPSRPEYHPGSPARCIDNPDRGSSWKPEGIGGDHSRTPANCRPARNRRPVNQKGPIGSPWTTGEWLFTPATVRPKSSARLAFHPKLIPQLTQSALVRR